MKKCCIGVILLTLLCTASFAQDMTGPSPLDNLPPHITQLVQWGQRADWSHDGTRILFLEKTFGDVYEIDLQANIIRPMTHHYYHEGYTRALYLSNGDILLSGARQFDAENPQPSRYEHPELWVLPIDLSGPPVALGEKCFEGPTVSRKNLKIAWTYDGTIHKANIVYKDGISGLTGKTKVLSQDDLDFDCELETQNFRPPEENELIFSAYGYRGTEVMGITFDTGKIVNYSNADNQSDEPEGIFPDGIHTLVETDKHKSGGRKSVGIHFVDIHKLTLDGSGDYERLTHFSDYEGYKASNPVVSDDGNYIAFQFARKGDPPGVGRGLLIFDIRKYEASKK